LKRKDHLLVWPALTVFILDQISKWAVMKGFQPYESIPVIEGLFNLTLVHNRGMAFGIMNRNQGGLGFYFLILATLGAIAVLLYWVRHLKENEWGITLGLGLILGGAVGNLVDRVRLGAVVDFLDFHLGSLHWPAFNLADSAITVGTIWVASYLILRSRHRT
jgi:signal peptidase II